MLIRRGHGVSTAVKHDTALKSACAVSLVPTLAYIHARIYDILILFHRMTFELARPLKIRPGRFYHVSDVKGRENFLRGYVVNATLTRKIVQHRARLVDASVQAGLARQLRLRLREVSSLYFFYC